MKCRRDSRACAMIRSEGSPVRSASAPAAAASARKSAPARERGVERAGRGVPEQPVVHDEQVCFCGRGELEQLEVRADPGRNGRHVLGAGHLQAVGAVILEARRLEQGVELVDDLGERYGGHEGEDIRPRAAGGVWNTGLRLGAWRSLVARTVRVGEVPGSNPGAPIERRPVVLQGISTLADATWASLVTGSRAPMPDVVPNTGVLGRRGPAQTPPRSRAQRVAAQTHCCSRGRGERDLAIGEQRSRYRLGRSSRELVGVERSMLDVAIAGRGARRVLSLSGQLDLDSASQLDRALEAVCADGVREVVLNLQKVDFIDTTGLGTIL